MPIGLTVRGELVFPWECRAIIERERGPVSVDISAPSKDATAELAKDPVQSVPASSPVAKSAAIDTTTKNQATPQSADVERVATIPDTASPPALPAATIGPPLNRKQAKRLAGRVRTDVRGSPSPVQPATGRSIR